MKGMWLLVFVSVLSVASVQAVSFANLCQLELKQANVDLNAYYPGLVGAKSLSILRYSGEWDGKGKSDTCAVILDGCVNCNCGDNTALLIQALSWTVKCIDIPKSVTAAQQRTVNQPDEQEKKEEPVHADEHELTGSPPPNSYRRLVADILNNSPSNDDLPLPQVLPAAPDQAQNTTTTEDPLIALVHQNQDQFENFAENAKAIGNAPQARMSGSVDNAETKQRSDPTATTKASTNQDAPSADIETTLAPPGDDTNANIKTESTSTDGSTTASTTASPIEEDEKEFFELNADSKKVKEDKSKKEEEGEEEATTNSPEFLSVFGQMSSWRSRYFVVLGFFLVFSFIFIIVIVVLYLKLKEARKNGKVGNISPGPGDDNIRTPMIPKDQQNFDFNEATLPR